MTHEMVKLMLHNTRSLLCHQECQATDLRKSRMYAKERSAYIVSVHYQEYLLETSNWIRYLPDEILVRNTDSSIIHQAGVYKYYSSYYRSLWAHL
jgi:hypothetical protein